MPDNTPFPERWLAERKADQPHSETLSAIEAALTDQSLDEARLLARLSATIMSTNARQEQ